MNAELVYQCAWCRSVLIGAEYVAASPVKWALVSHGICPACKDSAFPELATECRQDAGSTLQKEAA